MLKPVTDKTFHELVRETTDPVIILFTSNSPYTEDFSNFVTVVEDYAQRVEKEDITVLQGQIEEIEETAMDLSINSVPSMALFSDGMLRDILPGQHSITGIRLWVAENI